MTEREAVKQIHKLMQNSKSTIKQFKEVAKACNREIWFSLRKPVRNIEINVSRGTVKKTRKDGSK